MKFRPNLKPLLFTVLLLLPAYNGQLSAQTEDEPGPFRAELIIDINPAGADISLFGPGGKEKARFNSVEQPPVQITVTEPGIYTVKSSREKYLPLSRAVTIDQPETYKIDLNFEQKKSEQRREKPSVITVRDPIWRFGYGGGIGRVVNEDGDLNRIYGKGQAFLLDLMAADNSKDRYFYQPQFYSRLMVRHYNRQSGNITVSEKSDYSSEVYQISYDFGLRFEGTLNLGGEYLLPYALISLRLLYYHDANLLKPVYDRLAPGVTFGLGLEYLFIEGLSIFGEMSRGYTAIRKYNANVEGTQYYFGVSYR